MANPQLSVEITAKIDGLRDSFNKAVREIGNLDKSTRQQLSSIDKSFSNLANDIDKDMGKAASSVSQASNKISKNLSDMAMISAKSGKAVAVGSNQAGMALTNLGRVAQDAPFGFIGIQNNLNPLLESFQRLKVETGSTGSALKALAGSLIGAGGLGLALSVVSSLFLVYQQYSQKAAKADEEKKKATVDAKEALNDYIKSLDAKTRAEVNGSISAQKEVLDLKLLYQAAQSLLLPMNERVKAAKAIKEQYPDAFKNFSAEQIALGKASAGYKQLAGDIISLAKVEARKDIILENEKEIAQLEQKGKKLKIQKGLQETIAKQNKEDAKNVKIIGGNSFGGISTSNADLTRAADQTSGLNKANKELADNKKLISEKTKESLALEKEITDNVVKQQSVTSLTGLDGLEEKSKKLKSFAEIIAELNTALNVNQGKQGLSYYEKIVLDLQDYQKGIDSLIENGFKKEGKEVQGLATKYEALNTAIKNRPLAGNLTPSDVVKLNPNPNRPEAVAPLILIEKTITALDRLRSQYGFTDEALGTFVENFGLGFSEIEKLTEDFNAGFKELISGGFMATVGNLGSAIGEAFATGGNVLQSAGQELLKGFGSFLSGYGDLLIKYGAAAILKAKLDAAALIPGAGIPAGIAAIAAGIALRAAGAAVNSFASKGNSSNSSNSSSSNGFKPIKGFASGVQNFRGGIAMVGERGPELVSLPTGSSVIPNDRTNRILSNNRGNQNVQIFGEVGFNMEQFVIRFRNAERRIERSGA